MATKKTMHELAKEFPEKTYRELEKYRDADRREEAQQIITQQENEELKENQLTESQRRQEQLEPIEDESLHQSIHIEVWKARYEKEYKLRQEAIELFNACHAKALELEEELKKLKKKIDPVHVTQKARESGL